MHRNSGDMSIAPVASQLS